MMKTFTRVLLLLALLILIGSLAQGVLAQDDPTPPPAADSGPNTLEALIALLTTAFIVPIAAPLVTLLTSVFKRVFNVKPGVIALVLNLAFWVGWYATNALGYGDLFNALIPQLEQVIRVVLAIAGIVLSTGGASAVFKWSVANKIPLLSYQRTP